MMRRNSLWMSSGIMLVACLLTGCGRAPTFDVMGSFFPSWLVCLGGGILLTFLARWLLLRWKVVLVYPILVYPSIAAIFTFLLWLVFFG